MSVSKEFSSIFSIPIFLRYFDLVFGVFNVAQLISAIIQYQRQGDSIASIFSMLVFLIFNCLVSFGLHRFMGRNASERFRIVAGAVLTPLIFYYQAPAFAPWWPGIYIMTIGGITFLCLTFAKRRFAIYLIAYYLVAASVVEIAVMNQPFISVLSHLGLYAIISAAYFVVLTLIGNSVSVMIELQRAREAIVASKENDVRIKSIELAERLENKDKELAVYSLNFIQKNQLIENIRNEFYDLKINKLDGQVGKINGISKMLEDGFRIDRDWNEFKIYYEGTHKDFFKILKENYPELTSTDLKLCALIKVNLSTKEIARILGVLPESIKTARYRIRKKVGLKNSDNLFDFLNSIEPSDKQTV